MDRQLKRKKSTGNKLKLNWDAAIDFHQNFTKMGEILRDAVGERLLSFWSISNHTKNSLLTEGMALMKATLIFADMGLYQLNFERNCQKIINSINSKENNYSELRPIILDIQVLLRNNLVGKSVLALEKLTLLLTTLLSLHVQSKMISFN